MEALEMIRERRSYRAFKPEPITREVMQKIVEAAGNCSSYTNTQPWEMVVLSGRKRDELSGILYKLAEAHAPASPDIVLPTALTGQAQAQRFWATLQLSGQGN